MFTKLYEHQKEQNDKIDIFSLEQARLVERIVNEKEQKMIRFLQSMLTDRCNDIREDIASIVEIRISKLAEKENLTNQQFSRSLSEVLYKVEQIQISNVNTDVMVEKVKTDLLTKLATFETNQIRKASEEASTQNLLSNQVETLKTNFTEFGKLTEYNSRHLSNLEATFQDRFSETITELNKMLEKYRSESIELSDKKIEDLRVKLTIYLILRNSSGQAILFSDHHSLNTQIP